MTYFIAIVAAILSVLSAAIYALISKNATLKQIIASQAVKDQMKEWSDKIIASETKVTESERDYADAKAKLNTDTDSK